MTPDCDSKIIARLDEWEKEEGTLPNVLCLFRELIMLQTEERDHLKAERSKGMNLVPADMEYPVTKLERIEINWERFRKTFGRITSIIALHLGFGEQEMEGLEEGSLGFDRLRAILFEWYDEKKISDDVLSKIQRQVLFLALPVSVRPYLQVLGEDAAGELNQEEWRRKSCPLCGGTPDFTFLKGEYGARWLSCSRCDFEWRFQRIQCPCCGIADHTLLSVLTDEDGLYRVYTCDSCHRYIKGLDMRKAREEVFIPLEKVLTLNLDSQAEEKGYMPL